MLDVRDEQTGQSRLMRRMKLLPGYKVKSLYEKQSLGSEE